MRRERRVMSQDEPAIRGKSLRCWRGTEGSCMVGG